MDFHGTFFPLSVRDTDTRFSSDTDFSEEPDGRAANSAKGKVLSAHIGMLNFALL